MKYQLCVIGGAGHVGLPLSVAFANKKIKTLIFDINADALAIIEKGVFPFAEKNGDLQLKKALKAKNLFTSSDPSVLSQCKYIVMVIGTPIDKYLNPDMRGVYAVLDNYKEYFRDGQILILRSTIYPGTSARIQQYFDDHKIKVRVAFCPERIVEGKALEELEVLGQIVSAFDSKTLKSVSELFKKITRKKIIPLSPIEAELAKLYSNAWRYIKFAAANSFYMIAQQHGLEYQRIYHGMLEDYPRNQDLPSPGFTAGPCLHKDTMQLFSFSNDTFALGQASVLVNEGLPNFVVNKLKTQVGDLHTKKILILGMAFKVESDDGRDSLSFKLKKILDRQCQEVLCHDPYISEFAGDPFESMIQKVDIIILATPHKVYKKLEPTQLSNKIFVDIWDFWKKK
jgi:UDP-N-acetyl-D-mannosaminuronic acid dehydrogenase